MLIVCQAFSAVRAVVDIVVVALANDEIVSISVIALQMIVVFSMIDCYCNENKEEFYLKLKLKHFNKMRYVHCATNQFHLLGW